MLKTKAIPEFFYARYGYAVETLATDLMRTKTFAGLQVESQVATGATRPDFVVSSRREQLGWLDVTSEASQGHIFKKQHSGWTNRPYVAEILYPPPGVTDFGSGNLSESQMSSLREIETNNAQDELDYDNGVEALGIVIQDALEAAAAKSSDGRLGASVTKTVVTSALKAVFGGDLTASIAGQILRCVKVIDVNDSVHSGPSWATWAFGAGGYKEGRKAIIAYGARLRGGGRSRGEAMDTNAQEEEFGDENDAAMEENSDDEEKSE
jgi:hypothetical protein